MKTLVSGVVLFVLAGTAAAQDGILLRYQPSKEPLIYRKISKVKQTQTVMDKKLINEITQTEVDVWSLTETDKKALQVKSETKRLELKMKLDKEVYTFDSRKDDNDKESTIGAALTPVYERLASATLTYTVTDRGEITKLEGFKELLADVLKDNPIGQQFTAGGSDEAAKLGVAEYFPRLPDKPVTPGQRWETPFQFNLDKFGKATGKKIYAYDGESQVGKRKTVKLTVTTELSFELDVDMGGAKVTGTLSITQSQGTIHFDPKSGCLVSITADYTVSGNLNVAAGGKDIPIGMEQTQHVAMELLDALPK